MKFWSKGLIFSAAVMMMIGALVSIGFATSQTTPAPRVAVASAIAHRTDKVAPGTAIPVIPHAAAALFGQQSAAAAASTPIARAAQGTQTSEQVFKNIQVLKGIRVDEFMGTMGVFTTSLSLCCGNCHTGAGTEDPKWEDDPPRKKTARAMVTMVNDLNQKNFNGRQVVTCWTCHRGQLSPSVTPPLDFAYGEAVVVLPDQLPRDTSGRATTVDQIFAKYVQALGGQARVDALTSYNANGTSILYGEVGKGDPAEIHAKTAGNQLSEIVHVAEGTVFRVFDGTTGWWQLPLTITPTYPLNGTLLEGAKIDAAMAFPWRIRQVLPNYNWRLSYPSVIDGTEVEVIAGNTPPQGAAAPGNLVTLYFDKNTGLLKRSIRYASTMVGRIPTQIDYADYRPVAGVQMPFKFSYAWVSQREEWTLTGYTPNPPAMAASLFAKPTVN